ncbi:MAG: pyridoxal phosphate-dependent aminotransferase [Phycisphaerales bacterium]|nr:pyridoxal phosphate-dependent aminotransferase [Phycisphaerales bacterium]
MKIPPVEFLIWAKRHRRAKYEMTVSGAPPVELTDFQAGLGHVEIKIRGTCGDPRIIHAVAERYGVDPLGVVPVPGASGGNFVVMASVADRTRPILIEEPVYGPMRRAAEFFNARLIELPRRPEGDFRLDPDDLRAGLQRGAGTVFITNLHNPSAQLISADEMQRIALTAREHGAVVVVDEVYLDSPHVNLGAPRWTAATLADNVVVVNSLTKVYGVGSLRLGWLMTTPSRARHLRRMMDYLNVEHPAPATSLGLRAFEKIELLEARTRRLYEQARPVVREWLAAHPELHAYPNHGALFECVRLPRGVKAGTLSRLLYREYETRIVPGEFFNLPDHIRVSTTLPPAELRIGLDRIAQAVQRLQS